MIWQLLGLGVVLALNNAMAAVALGADDVGRARQVRIAVTFALFEALMPILGVVVGRSFAMAAGSKAHVIGVAVLALTGLYSLLKREKAKKSGADTQRSHRWKTIGYAVVLSLDNLAVGFSLGLFSVPVVTAAVIFGLVSLLLTFLGLEVGRMMKHQLTLSADKFAGAVLLAAACVMYFV